MSTSLKVVSIAAVFCASLRRRAMVWRSLRHPHALLARLVVRRDRRARATAAGAGCGGGRCDGAPPGDGVQHVALQHLAALAASRRPGRPRDLLSASSLAAAGAGGIAPFDLARGAAASAIGLAVWRRPLGLSTRARRRRACRAACGRLAGAAWPPPPSRDRAEQRADTDGLAVLAPRSRSSMPAAGAGTSTVTLSVSSSTSGSSAATASPPS